MTCWPEETLSDAVVQIILINFAKQPTLSDVGYQHNQSIIKRRNRVQTILPGSVVSYVNNRLLCVWCSICFEQNRITTPSPAVCRNVLQPYKECVAYFRWFCSACSSWVFHSVSPTTERDDVHYRQIVLWHEAERATTNWTAGMIMRAVWLEQSELIPTFVHPEHRQTERKKLFNWW